MGFLGSIAPGNPRICRAFREEQGGGSREGLSELQGITGK